MFQFGTLRCRFGLYYILVSRLVGCKTSEFEFVTAILDWQSATYLCVSIFLLLLQFFRFVHTWLDKTLNFSLFTYNYLMQRTCMSSPRYWWRTSWWAAPWRCRTPSRRWRAGAPPCGSPPWRQCRPERPPAGSAPRSLGKLKQCMYVKERFLDARTRYDLFLRGCFCLAGDDFQSVVKIVTTH